MKPQATAEQLLKRLAGHSIIAAAQAEADAKIESERQAHIDAIAALEGQRERDLPRLRKATIEAHAAVAAARLELRNAEQTFQAAFGAEQGRGNQLTGQIARHEHELDLSADESIDDFCAELRGIKSKVRHLNWAREMRGKVNLATGIASTVTQSNHEVIITALAAIDTAIEAALKMKREASQAGLDERLDALRLSLPPLARGALS